MKVVNMGPQPAANAIIAGNNDIDAAMTYEPYLGAVRAKPEAGKIIATTLDYPMVMDTFGCTPKFLAENPKAAKALADGYFDAVAMIKADPKKSFEIMGADVKQTGEAFEKSQAYLRWQDRDANQRFFATGEHADFSKEADELISLMLGVTRPGVTGVSPNAARTASASRADSSGPAARSRTAWNATPAATPSPASHASSVPSAAYRPKSRIEAMSVTASEAYAEPAARAAAARATW